MASKKKPGRLYVSDLFCGNRIQNRLHGWTIEMVESTPDIHFLSMKGIGRKALAELREQIVCFRENPEKYFKFFGRDLNELERKVEYHTTELARYKAERDKAASIFMRLKNYGQK